MASPTYRRLWLTPPRFRYRGPRESCKWNVTQDALLSAAEQAAGWVARATDYTNETLADYAAAQDAAMSRLIALRNVARLRAEEA